MITTPLITRIADPSEYGQLSVFNAYADIMLAFLYLGLDRSLMRFFYDDEIEAMGGKIYRCSVREDNNLLKYFSFLYHFFKSHPVFYLLTPDANYNCHVFTFAKTTDDSVFYTTSFGDYRLETLDSMKQSSTYFNDMVNTDQKFVSLSTCDLDYGFESSHRFVLTGQLEKTSDDIVLKD